MRPFLLVATFAAMVSACGSSSPTAPTPTIPMIAGQWTGPYTISSCVESGAALGSGFCAALGSGGGMVFTPQQNGANVSGTLGIGGFNIPVTGTAGTDQAVVLAGSGVIAVNTILALNTWRGTVSGNTLAGAVSYTITSSIPIGSATVSGNFNLTK